LSIFNGRLNTTIKDKRQKEKDKSGRINKALDKSLKKKQEQIQDKNGREKE
jgi:hypothetical protein